MASGHTGNDAATAEIPEENGDFEALLALGAARDVNLARIVASSPTLPDAIRRAMLALVS